MFSAAPRNCSGSSRAPTVCRRPPARWAAPATTATSCSTSCAAASSPTATNSIARPAGLCAQCEPGTRRPPCRLLPPPAASAALPPVGGRGARAGDPQLERLCREYLPLTFSRRHGDPSRPWNRFSIATRNADGTRSLNYEGNWRDIFQNWEALAVSFPGYVRA